MTFDFASDATMRVLWGIAILSGKKPRKPNERRDPYSSGGVWGEHYSRKVSCFTAGPL
jgi:hypothetical protein